MERISREDVQRIIKRSPDLRIVDVLPPESFGDYHLPRAINVPWGGDFRRQRRFEQQIQNAVPLKNAPVIVYSLDRASAASSQAARRMQELGFERVFDYADGKTDWKAAGLPVESE